MADPKLVVRQTLDNSQFKRGLKDSQGALGSLKSSIMSIGPAMAASFSVAAIVSFMKTAVTAYDTQVKAEAKVKRAITATGGAAGYTSEQLFKMASGLQSVTRFGDEEILNGVTAQLLTFTNIAGSQFARTQKLALDLATVLEVDLKSAAIQLGKALNDPIANLSALGRSGIQFSSAQKDLIKRLAQENRLWEAQNVILTEIERQYGGQAEAVAKVGLGRWVKVWNDLGDGMEVAGKWLMYFVDGTLQLGTAINNLTWRPFYNIWKSMQPLPGLAKETAEEMKKWGEGFQNPLAGQVFKMPDVEKGAIETIKERIKALTTALELVPEGKIAAINIELKGLNEELDRLQNLGLEQSSHPIEQIATIDTTEGVTQLQNLTQGYYDLAVAQGLAKQSTQTTADAIKENSDSISYSFQRMGDALGDSIAEFAKGEKTFRELVFDMLGTIIKMIAGYLAQTVASAFAGGASVGGPAAAATGAIAAGAAAALFGSVVPAAMATGGTVPGGFPGDTYPAMLSSGETVIPAPIPLSQSMGWGGQVDFVLRGENLYGTFKKQESKQARYK